MLCHPSRATLDAPGLQEARHRQRFGTGSNLHANSAVRPAARQLMHFTDDPVLGASRPPTCFLPERPYRRECLGGPGIQLPIAQRLSTEPTQNTDAAEMAEPIDMIEPEDRIVCAPGHFPASHGPVPASPMPAWSGFQKTVIQFAVTMR